MFRRHEIIVTLSDAATRRAPFIHLFIICYAPSDDSATFIFSSSEYAMPLRYLRQIEGFSCTLMAAR